MLCPQECLSDTGYSLRKIAFLQTLIPPVFLRLAPVLQVGVRVGGLQILGAWLLYPLSEGFTDFRISSPSQLP